MSDPAERANAMTVDVEDYFQVSAMEPVVDRQAWDSYECRVECNVDRLLSLFDRGNAKATFFTLGWIAQRYPAMLRRIVDAGHEIASHGLCHVRVSSQSPAAFRADVRAAKAMIEDAAGVTVRGYRAASFSMTPATGWAHEILADEGHAYSSSVFPGRTDHYGIPDAPRRATRPLAGKSFVEIPITVVDFAGRRIPCGGGWFRLLPPQLSERGIRLANRRDKMPAIFYLHPWEIDPDQPRLAGISLRTRIRHYTGLARMEARLVRLLGRFRWDRMDRIFLNPESEAG